MTISAISFDGDMTLWDFQKVMRHALKKALAELRRLVPTQRAADLSVEEMIAIRNRVEEEEQGRTWNMEELRLLAFERTLENLGCPDLDLAGHLNELYLKHRFEDIELYRDVEPALDVLAPHYKLGLLSNGNSYPERCGLEGRFAFVVFSQDVQIRKPDRRIFEIAAQRAGCPIEELLHVGDSLENDVMGAHGAGAKTVWLNREGAESHAEIKPDVEITSLADLSGVLGLGQIGN
ncbi:MAG: HAD family hydrolase [Gemmatimonadetes bacterium]|nr:HAD family hydrolase [Gemmatimonadota bacterium]MYH18390.1 HAD family hydrolase [Gemmatimonadota bacterium]